VPDWPLEMGRDVRVKNMRKQYGHVISKRPGTVKISLYVPQVESLS
jgi:hypothetical protein